MLGARQDAFAAFSAHGLASRPAILAAVSGGSDSTALLILLTEFFDRFAPSVRLIAATVDHGLRAESATEAAAVGRLSERHGIRHVTLVWHGPKPKLGVSAAAREARYDLLAEAARDAGTDIIAVAHTADDQAETVQMRRKRGEGLGLAGIAPVTLYENRLWIVRPLLSLRRTDLRDYLRSRGVDWAEDPSNADPRYERARTRVEIASSGEIAPLLEVAREHAERRTDLGHRAAGLIGRHSVMEPSGSWVPSSVIRSSPIDALPSFARRPPHPAKGETPGSPPSSPSRGEQSDMAHPRSGLGVDNPCATDLTLMGEKHAGPIRLSPSFAHDPDREAAHYALRLLLAVAGGTPHLPTDGRTGALLERLKAPPFRATLSRALVVARRDGIWLCRETRALPAPQPARDGMVWDGRYRLHSSASAQAATVEPAMIRAPEGQGPGFLPAVIAAAAARACPAFRPASSGSATSPHAHDGEPLGWSAEPVMAPWARFLPGFDLEVARAIARLIGAPLPPDAPCRGHIVTRA